MNDSERLQCKSPANNAHLTTIRWEYVTNYS